MPALTISTNMDRRSASPERPPMSPITPVQTPSSPSAATADPTQAQNGQQTQSTTTSTIPPPLNLTHTTHPSQPTAQPAPPPEPIDFASNADAIALRSAISVLQLQRKKADKHIQLLNDARPDALADPHRFADQLENAQRTGSSANLPWKDAFKPQAIGHCPQINWDQYAIVGEPLDAIHREQVTHPSATEPSVYTNGAYESKGPAPGAAGKAEEYRGPLAPYNPWLEKDMIDNKGGQKK